MKCYPYSTDTEVFAVPGGHGIIDTLDSETGLSRVMGRTLEQVAVQYPGAVRMTWDAWTEERSARQRTAIVWLLTTSDQFDKMLNVLPPAMMIAGAFLVGEPADHDVKDGQPRFEAYWNKNGRFYVTDRPITRTELRAEVARGLVAAPVVVPGCGECNGTGKLTTLGGDWGKTAEGVVTCWKCHGTGKGGR